MKEGKGSVSFVTQGQVVSEDVRKYTSGSEVTVAAVPDKGNEFVCWQDGNGQQLSASRSYTFTINNDMTLQAVPSSRRRNTIIPISSVSLVLRDMDALLRVVEP